MKLFGIKFSRAKKKQPKAAEEKKTEEVPRERVPGRLQYEIVRQKDARTIVVKRGRIGNKKEFLDWRRRRFYPNHIIKEVVDRRVRYFVRWNLYQSEAYDVLGNIAYDPKLENVLMNDMEVQLGKAVGAAVGFILERPMIYVIALAFLVSIPIGFSYNDIFHWVPNTVIHWVPRA
ncbi:MAG: hypothetical protein KGH74_03610 [Candidatus Micrarchaeota archaeon]|nr:hypothetical protein [Candidatus Micrarchaeota archaeon]